MSEWLIAVIIVLAFIAGTFFGRFLCQLAAVCYVNHDDLTNALDALAERHKWSPNLGECICEEHKNAKELVNKYEALT